MEPLTVSGSEHGDGESESSSSSSSGGEDEGDPVLGAAGGALNPNPQQIDAALDVLLNDTLYNAAQQDAAFEALLRGIVRNVTEVEGPPTMLRLEEQHQDQEEQGEGEETGKVIVVHRDQGRQQVMRTDPLNTPVPYVDIR